MQILSYDDRAVPIEQLGLKLYTSCKSQAGAMNEGGKCSNIDKQTKVQ